MLNVIKIVQSCWLKSLNKWQLSSGFGFLKTGILALSGYIMCVCDAYLIRMRYSDWYWNIRMHVNTIPLRSVCRWGLCCSAFRWKLLLWVLYPTHPSWWAHRPANRWHSTPQIWRKTDREAVWWVHCVFLYSNAWFKKKTVQNYDKMFSFLSKEAMAISLRFFFFIPDFIKIGDDPGAGKGRSGDNTKM